MAKGLPPGARRLESGRIKLTLDAPAGPDGKRRQRSWTLDTVDQARAKWAEHQTELTEGSYVAPAADTVDGWLDGWVAGKRRTLKPTTVSGYVAALTHVRSALGPRRLQSLTRVDVERVMTSMTAAGKAPRTANLTLTVFRSALADAVTDGLLRSNPAALVRRSRETRPELTTWTAGELATYLDAAAGHPWRAGVELSGLGLRRGEVVGLRWSDVGPASVTIATTRVTVEGRTVESTPKSDRGRRTLPLDQVPSVLDALADARSAAGLRVRSPGATVLADERGRPVRPERYADELVRLMAVAGVPVIRPHDIRHTFATLALQAGQPVHLVAAWLGHDPVVLLRSYAHAIPNTLGAVPASVIRATA